MKRSILGHSKFPAVLFALRATRVAEKFLVTQRVKRVAAMLFITFMLISGLLACGEELTVEQQIIHQIREMEAQAEAGERRPFMANVSDTFLGQGGAMDRESFRVFFTMQLSQYNRMQAALMPIAVSDLGDGRATARFKALVTGGNRNLVPEAGQVFQFSTAWVHQGGEWKLDAADWEPVY